ncbi:DUF2399 domain-containing protein, partial [Myxococcota bacterium]|nr:DUF2399 domain-containing protein [Myxococcota bacterium]
KEYSTWNRRFGERYARLDPKTIAGKIPEAVWDSELRGVMQEYGRPIYEEMVLDELMGDLGSDR